MITAILVLAAVLAGMVEAAASETNVDMEFRNANILDVLQVLGELGGLNILADQSVAGNITLYLRSMPVLDAIDLVTRTSGYRYKLLDNTLVVASAERLASEFTREAVAVFQPKHLTAATVQKIASITLDETRMIIDERTGTLILRGPEPEVKKAEALLQRLDVPAPMEFEFINRPIQEILRTLAKAGGCSLIIDPAVEGSYTIYLHDQDIAGALKVVAQAAGLEYRFSDGILVVTPQRASDAPDLEVSDSNEEVAEPDPASKLRVTGVVRAGEDRLAIVELDGKSRIVKPGDEVANMLVESIGDRAVIMRQGEYQRRYQIGGDL